MTEPIAFKPDNGERKELADEADALLKNKAFTEALLRLRKQWFGEWLRAEPQHLVKYQAELNALEAIPQQLQILINDEIMAQRGKRG